MKKKDLEKINLSKETIELAKIQALNSIVDTDELITSEMYDDFVISSKHRLRAPIWEPFEGKSRDELIRQCRYEFNNYINFAKAVVYREMKQKTKELNFSFSDFDYEETRKNWNGICNQLDVDADKTKFISVNYVDIEVDEKEEEGVA